jgi:hypothetical protein
VQRVPNQPATPGRNFRYGDEQWQLLGAIASDLGIGSTSELVRLALDRIVREYTGPGGLDGVARMLGVER